MTPRLIVGLLLLAVAAGALGQAEKSWEGWEGNFDDEQKAWKEIEARIPPYPEPARMRQFEAGDGRGYRHYLDAGSVSAGEDGVVRFTVAVVTPGGGRNVTFEGIRCEERHYRIYAIGRPDRTWSRARNSEWRRIEYQDVGNHRGILFAEFFCNNKVVKPPQEIRRLVEQAGSSVINRGPYPGP